MNNSYSSEVLSARVGKNLGKLIRRQGFTQYSFAMELGVDQRTVSRWIKDGIHDVDTIYRAACILRVSFGDLVSVDNGDEIPLFHIPPAQPKGCRGLSYRKEKTSCVRMKMVWQPQQTTQEALS